MARLLVIFFIIAVPFFFLFHSAPRWKWPVVRSLLAAFGVAAVATITALAVLALIAAVG